MSTTTRVFFLTRVHTSCAVRVLKPSVCIHIGACIVKWRVKWVDNSVIVAIGHKFKGLVVCSHLHATTSSLWRVNTTRGNDNLATCHTTMTVASRIGAVAAGLLAAAVVLLVLELADENNPLDYFASHWHPSALMSNVHCDCAMQPGGECFSGDWEGMVRNRTAVGVLPHNVSSLHLARHHICGGTPAQVLGCVRPDLSKWERSGGVPPMTREDRRQANAAFIDLFTRTLDGCEGDVMDVMAAEYGEDEEGEGGGDEEEQGEGGDDDPAGEERAIAGRVGHDAGGAASMAAALATHTHVKSSDTSKGKFSGGHHRGTQQQSVVARELQQGTGVAGRRASSVVHRRLLYWGLPKGHLRPEYDGEDPDHGSSPPGLQSRVFAQARAATHRALSAIGLARSDDDGVDDDDDDVTPGKASPGSGDSGATTVTTIQLDTHRGDGAPTGRELDLVSVSDFLDEFAEWHDGQPPIAMQIMGPGWRRCMRRFVWGLQKRKVCNVGKDLVHWGRGFRSVHLYTRGMEPELNGDYSHTSRGAPGTGKFVLQALGTTTWQLAPNDAPTTTRATLTSRAGDIVYLPQAWVVEAQCLTSRCVSMVV